MYKIVKYKKNESFDYHFNKLKDDLLFNRFSVDTLFKEDYIENLDFLKDYSFIKNFSINCFSDINFEGLKYLTNLEKINIQIHLNKSSIDLSNMTELKEMNVYWNKKITGLYNCKKLEELQVWHFNHPNLDPFLELTNLEVLDIRTGSIKNLDGISKLKKLKYLKLANCSRLLSIKEIENLKNLEELVLDTCSNIKDYEEIKEFENLKKFEVVNSKVIASIKFLLKANKLENIRIAGPRMKIIDGDFRFIKNMNLKYFSIDPKEKHYVF